MGSSIRGGLVFVALVALFATDAAAQMNNRPFSFGGGASLGISNAGKQAILQEKLTGSTPDNIRKGLSGLITITRGPGNNAIARGADGATIPGFKGTSRAVSGGVGIFNPYFLGSSGRRSGTLSFASRHTSNAISGWTSMVSGNSRYRGGNSVDAWTSQVGG